MTLVFFFNRKSNTERSWRLRGRERQKDSSAVELTLEDPDFDPSTYCVTETTSYDEKFGRYVCTKRDDESKDDDNSTDSNTSEDSDQYKDIVKRFKYIIEQYKNDDMPKDILEQPEDMLKFRNDREEHKHDHELPLLTRDALEQERMIIPNALDTAFREDLPGRVDSSGSASLKSHMPDDANLEPWLSTLSTSLDTFSRDRRATVIAHMPSFVNIPSQTEIYKFREDNNGRRNKWFNRVGYQIVRLLIKPTSYLLIATVLLVFALTVASPAWNIPLEGLPWVLGIVNYSIQSVQTACEKVGVGFFPICKPAASVVPSEPYSVIDLTTYNRLETSLKQFVDASKRGKVLYKAIYIPEIPLPAISDIARENELPFAWDLGRVADRLNFNLPPASHNLHELSSRARWLIVLFSLSVDVMVRHLNSVCAQVEDEYDWWKVDKWFHSERDKEWRVYEICLTYWNEFSEDLQQEMIEFLELSDYTKKVMKRIQRETKTLGAYARKAREEWEEERGEEERQLLGDGWRHGALAMLVNDLHPLDYLDKDVDYAVDTVAAMNDAALQLDSLIKDLARARQEKDVREDPRIIVPSVDDFFNITEKFLEIVNRVDKPDDGN